MRKIFFIIAIVFASSKAFCEIRGLQFLTATNDSIKVEVKSLFTFTTAGCTMIGYDLYISSDTLHLNTYYDFSGIGPGFGVTGSTDTVCLGKWKEKGDVNVLKVTSFEVEKFDNRLDTTLRLPSKSIHRSLNISSIDKQSSIKVFPNPATLLLSISSEHPIHSAIIQNIQGMVLLKKQENIESIDIAGLSPGIYFLKLETSGGVFVKQFLKE